MTPETFKSTRKDLGLSILALTSALSVGKHPGPNERTIRRWEKGEWPIPGPVVLAMRHLKKSSKKITLARSSTPFTPTLKGGG